MNQETMTPEAIGNQLGTASVDAVIEKLDAYSACKQREIELENQPDLEALEAEGSLLLQDKAELERRLRNAPPAELDLRTRKKKSVYYWATAIVLWLCGMAATWMTLEPFRMGWMGLGLVVALSGACPFLVDLALEYWNADRILKYVATLLALAALGSLMCFSVIRGKLFVEQLRAEDTTAVIVDDDQQGTAPTPVNHAALLPNIAELIEDGDITLGRLHPIGCVATAADEDRCLAMLVRHRGETLGQLLTRLDRAIGKAINEDIFPDEINPPPTRS